MSEITKKALAASFMKLLNQTTLDKITIKDIVDECGVNRNTFYYHFQDVYDLMDWIFIIEAKQVIDENKHTIIGSKASTVSKLFVGKQEVNFSCL